MINFLDVDSERVWEAYVIFKAKKKLLNNNFFILTLFRKLFQRLGYIRSNDVANFWLLTKMQSKISAKKNHSFIKTHRRTKCDNEIENNLSNDSDRCSISHGSVCDSNCFSVVVFFWNILKLLLYLNLIYKNILNKKIY